MSTIVFSFGRYQGPSCGHEFVFDFCARTAEELNAEYLIVPSKTHNKDNPLPFDVKVEIIKDLMPQHANNISDKHPNTIIGIMQMLQDKYNNVVFVCGEDRVDQFTKLLKAYNNVEYFFNTIEVISCGTRNETGNRIQKASGTAVRTAVAKSRIEEYFDLAPSMASIGAITRSFARMADYIESREACVPKGRTVHNT